MGKVQHLLGRLFGSKLRIIIIFVLIILGVGFWYRNISSQNTKPQYQTAQAQKDTLVQTVTASGQITNANNVSITIQASGVVDKVLVKNGDQVSQGQTIATLTLDQASQQKSTAAFASYLSAKNALDIANAKYNSLQNSLFVANQKFINDAVARGLQTNDPTYIEEDAAWLQAEADYKNQDLAVKAAQSSLGASGLNLSQLSSTITAPASGIVKGLTITPGAIVTVTSSSANAAGSSQVLGSVYQAGPIQANVNLSEIDSVKVSEGQKVTMTLDAFPNLTFTGKVVSINTNGIISSGVTSYPTVISFDTTNDHIYPNMAVNAKIITAVKNDVILVPSSAVQNDASGQSTVRILKNGVAVATPVQVGESSDTQTEITSGVAEGDTVVTGTVNSAGGGRNSSSPFGAIRGFGGFGGGGGGVRRGG